MRGLAPILAATLLCGCATTPQLDAGDAAAGAPAMPVSQYDEQYRPAYHYTPPGGWMNDPNGLVYHDGEWHMFYQYYPHDTVWGPMHWAHAVSRDLVNWQTLPIAIAPDDQGYIFSGSAVIDTRDTAGFGEDAMVALYTIHDPVRGAANTRDHESQGIAVSFDNGRTFRKFSGNPVLPNPGKTQDFRDPNVFRDEARGRWVMSLSVHDHVRFYASTNLKEWTYLSSFGAGESGPDGVWECPNLFPITDEASGETRWVLIQNINPGGPQGGSGTFYFVGDWDGTRFTPDPDFGSDPVWLDHGADNYAGITWDNAPDARRVFIGWMSNWLYAQEVPTQAWRSAMTIPREISLNGLELRQQPVAELQQLREMAFALAPNASAQTVPSAAEYDLQFRLPDSDSSFTLTFSNDEGERLALGLNDAGHWFVDRTNAGDSGFNPAFAAIHTAPRLREDKSARVRLFVDNASVELFPDDGATVMTEIFFPSEPFTSISLQTEGGAQLVSGQGWPLKPADFGQ
ncbi:glycoside hydrolase family 32 protein [Aurantiacibacter rhizosphaerae]|uniref:Glycoside hydrolase family 32 protein n=1 Tax=Aurantiacibacter rhizosphaerae TaxID=2691582 RepID=A0A844X902_9SPHN|nr:glycoside hydrolase family 32 protein [Aurantiacibacter rhizosphaerae]MWV26446.1 glycoside hydrolase family 32 protein [Aurantiacibacter rhizosphaerae]